VGRIVSIRGESKPKSAVPNLLLMRVSSSTTAARDPLRAVSRLWKTCPPLDAAAFCVGAFCSLEELERRESSWGDGGVEGKAARTCPSK